MGADPSRILLLEGVVDDKGPRLPHVADIEAIREAVEEIDARLVIVDPLMAALPGAVDSHSDQNVRSVLAPLAKLAQEMGVTILVVRHLNKSASGNALYRGGGSIGIVAAARAAFLVAKDPEDANFRVIAPTKLNIAPEPPALRFRISANAEGDPTLEWEGVSCHTAQDLLQSGDKRKDRPEPQSDKAKELLQSLLKTGRVPVDQIKKECTAEGIGWRTMEGCKKTLDVVSFRDGLTGPWYWDFPHRNPNTLKDDCGLGKSTDCIEISHTAKGISQKRVAVWEESRTVANLRPHRNELSEKGLQTVSPGKKPQKISRRYPPPNSGFDPSGPLHGSTQTVFFGNIKSKEDTKSEKENDPGKLISIPLDYCDRCDGEIWEEDLPCPCVEFEGYTRTEEDVRLFEETERIQKIQDRYNRQWEGSLLKASGRKS